MRNATLLFLVKKEGDGIGHICLAMKKLGFGKGRWNGAGGKVENGETIEQAMIRESKEEIGVEPKDFYKVSELSFSFPHNPKWNQMVHTYFCEKWKGEPKESEEMAPRWFSVSDIPYTKMWPDDALWLPLTLEGGKIRAAFSLGEGDLIIDKDIHTVEKL